MTEYESPTETPQSTEPETRNFAFPDWLLDRLESCPSAEELHRTDHDEIIHTFDGGIICVGKVAMRSVLEVGDERKPVTAYYFSVLKAFGIDTPAIRDQKIHDGLKAKGLGAELHDVDTLPAETLAVVPAALLGTAHQMIKNSEG